MYNYKEKNFLVVGAARSGISTIKILNSLGANVYLSDIKTEENFSKVILETKEYVSGFIFGKQPDNLEKYDTIVLSPGVPTDLSFIIRAKEMGIKIIGELELAFILSKGKYIGITGTNGKTTTTALVGEIFKKSKFDSQVVGNIGIPAISKSLESKESTYMITEVSSFQLETVKEFHPFISAVLNITPDHLNRHKTMDNYIEAKSKIFAKCNRNDYLVLNYDDEISKKLGENSDANIVFFSRKKILDKGVFVEDRNIILKFHGKKEIILNIDDIFIKGDHNLENALAATLICYIAGIDSKLIAKTLMEFKGVEHRIEFVRDIENIKFYNDSKGTNPDASIKAIQSMDRPTVLIAGGMDKNSNFDEFVQSFGVVIKHIVLIGETKNKIADAAIKQGFFNYTFVEDMNEAVSAAYNIAEEGYNVLLSPACASWDMYESYEHRGREFKKNVKAL